MIQKGSCAEKEKRFGVVPSLTPLVILIILAVGIGWAHSNDATVRQQIETFLHEYYDGFELADLDRMAAGMTDDFTSTFYIPSQKKEPTSYDKRSMIEGLVAAFALYKGKNPRMEISNVVVVPRSETETLVSYRMDFYLRAEWKNAALAIADLRREKGGWKIYRLYENKRR